jgi:hypothetical protein
MTDDTDDWGLKFLATLREGWPVGTAARFAGIHRSNAYRRRKADPDFAAAWDDAFETGTDFLEEQAIRRAMEHSDHMMVMMLRARRPETYGEKLRLEHTRVDYQSGAEQLEARVQKLLAGAVKGDEENGQDAELDRSSTPTEPR